MNPSNQSIAVIKSAFVDGFQVLFPSGSSLAVVSLADLKDITAIITMAIGALCTILVSYKKLRNQKAEND